MYIYKIIITYSGGGVKTEWLCPNKGESLSDCETRMKGYIDDLEANVDIVHVKCTRRTMPGI